MMLQAGLNKNAADRRIGAPVTARDQTVITRKLDPMHFDGILINETVVVSRSDGTWTYAKLAKRTKKGLHFMMDASGATKCITKEWYADVRRLPPVRTRPFKKTVVPLIRASSARSEVGPAVPVDKQEDILKYQGIMANHIRERQRQAEEKTALMAYFHRVQADSAFIHDGLTGDELDTGGLQLSFVSTTKSNEPPVAQDALAFVETNFLKMGAQIATAEPASAENASEPLSPWFKIQPLSQPVIIKGPSACGKSSFMKQYLHKHSQAHLARDPRCLVPVFVPVYELAMLLAVNPDPSADHLKIVLERLFQGDEHASLLVRLLIAMREQKRLVVLLDGLDEGEGAGGHLEVVSTSTALTEYICGRLVGEVHLCVTSREQCVTHPATAALLRSASFVHATMLPLSEQQRHALIGHRLTCFAPSAEERQASANTSSATAKFSHTAKESPQQGGKGTRGGGGGGGGRGWMGVGSTSLKSQGVASAGTRTRRYSNSTADAAAVRGRGVQGADNIEAVAGFNYHMETPLLSALAEQMAHSAHSGDGDAHSGGQSMVLLNLLITEYRRTQLLSEKARKKTKKSSFPGGGQADDDDDDDDSDDDDDDDDGSVETEDMLQVQFVAPTIHYPHTLYCSHHNCTDIPYCTHHTALAILYSLYIALTIYCTQHAADGL
jgi:hypothetical protein